MHLDTLRIRAFPFADEVVDFINAHEQVFLIEQNRDAQMMKLHRQRMRHRSGAVHLACCITTARRSPRASSTAPSPTVINVTRKEAAE